MIVIKWLDRHLEEFLMMVFLCLMVIIMGLQVFMRYVLNNSLSWPEEITRYFFIWYIFLGMSYCIREDRHIKVDIVTNLLPNKIKRILAIITDILFIIFCIYLLQKGIPIIQRLISTKQSSPALRLPMYLVYLALPVGLFLTIIRIIEKLIRENAKKVNTNSMKG